MSIYVVCSYHTQNEYADGAPVENGGRKMWQFYVGIQYTRTTVQNVAFVDRDIEE